MKKINLCSYELYQNHNHSCPCNSDILVVFIQTFSKFFGTIIVLHYPFISYVGHPVLRKRI